MHVNRTVTFADSTNIAQAEWDMHLHQMIVTFVNSARYHYVMVTPELFAGLASANSPGAYFAKHIKALPYEKV